VILQANASEAPQAAEEAEATEGTSDSTELAETQDFTPGTDAYSGVSHIKTLHNITVYRIPKSSGGFTMPIVTRNW